VAIDYELRDGGIALITLNRPERMNALDAEHYRLLSEAWQRVRDDPAVRVAIVTGAGERAFCTGADLKDFIPAPEGLDQFWLTQRDQLLNRGLELWKPVIAAVDGYCLGGGMTLLLATDLRIATPSASFGLAEVKRGVIPGNGGSQRVLRQLPHAIGMELLLTGDRIDAAAAERWGLVNRVVEREHLLDEAFALAARVAANAPLAVQAAKELALRSYDVDLPTGLRFEQTILRLLQHTEDAQEGPAAFAEKRPPEFRGR
jgi:E-phenylitaconyl-CoA hydratase